MLKHISTQLKTFATKFAIALFRAVRLLKRGAQSALGFLGKILAPVGRLLVRLIILPIYRLGVMLKLRIHRLALPTRGVVLFVITNRYLLHVAIGVIAVLTVIGNFETRQVHAQDVGQKSVLFAMATDESNDIVVETVHPEAMIQNSSYLGSATVVGIPHVDFDYETTAQGDQTSAIGTITPQLTDSTSQESRVQRTRTEQYVVQDGDTISTIAHRFGVNVGTILWNNNLTDRQYIRPGDTLKIPSVSGILITVKKGDTFGKLAAKYDADANEIASANQLSIDSSLSVGVELVIPGAQPPSLEQTRTQVVKNRTPISSDEMAPSNEGSISQPEPVVPPPSIPKPPKANTASSGARLLWPTSGHAITQYYGWKHTGIDIDGDYSSPLYAAADGVVEKAGWNTGGYGLMILIDSPNGVRTRYGHASKLFVKAGDTVKKGDVIAMMGTTGRSTGTHLHFEVYVNGVRTNPLGYIR